MLLNLPPKASQLALIHPNYRIEKLYRLTYLEIRQVLSTVVSRAELYSFSVANYDTRIFVPGHVLGAAYAWCSKQVG